MKWINTLQFGSMNSLKNATNLAIGECAYSLNSNLGSNSQAASMPGYSKFGNQANDDDDDSIIRKYTYVKGDGIEIMLQVRDDATNYILEYLNKEDIRNSSTGEWSILEAGLSRSRTISDGTTKLADFGFAPYNDSGNDQLVYGNGVETRRIWNGAFGKISSSTVNTIVLNGTATCAERGFSSTGSVIVNGTSYTYTGLTSATFTGVTTDPTGEATGSGVAQTVDSTTLSALDNSSILLSTQSRLFQAGITATPNQVTFSDVGDLTSESGADPADGGFEDFPQMNGDITAISYIDEWIVVFSNKKIIAFKFNFPSSTTRTVIRKDISDEGCTNQKAVKKLGDQIWYVTPKGGLKYISQISAEGVFNVTDLTDRIRPTISNFVWDNACLEYDTKNRVWFMAGKSDSDQTVNDKAINVWMTLNEAGQLSTNLGICDWFISDMCNYNGSLYFGSGLQSDTFKAFDGYSKNGAPYKWKRTERIETYGAPWMRKAISHIGIIGAIGSGTKLIIRIKYGINGSISTQEMQLEGTDSDYVVQQPLNVLGGFELGTEPLGGTVKEIGDFNPFEVVFPLPTTYPRNIQVEFETEGSGQQVVVDYYSLNVGDPKEQIYAKELKSLGL